jgi:hypothetical protein
MLESLRSKENIGATGELGVGGIRDHIGHTIKDGVLKAEFG